MAHPRHRLDDAFQSAIRFSLMAALGRKIEVDFRTLSDLLEADDSVLRKPVSCLEKAGYVKGTKGFVGNRPRTWIEATTKGHLAYQQHLLAPRAITDDILDWSTRRDRWRRSFHMCPRAPRPSSRPMRRSSPRSTRRGMRSWPGYWTHRLSD